MDAGGDNVYNVTVQVRDDEFNRAELPVTVTVTDVNEGLEVTGGGNSFTVQENQAWPGAGFSATDPEGGTLSCWSLAGRDGGDFAISQDGVLTFRSLPDYERPADSNRDNVYDIAVQASDGQNSNAFDVTVTVTPVDEPPEITASRRTKFTVRENSTSVLYAYRATDPERATIRWSVEGDDGDDFAIYSGMLTFKRLPDFKIPADSNSDNGYRLTVVAADDPGNAPPWTFSSRSRTNPKGR